MYIEARCSAGTITRARIEIEIMPMKMDRDLLWVDDWVLGDYNPSMYSPSEEVHDEFWTAICSRAPGFDPGRDILPLDEMYVAVGEAPLPLEVLSHYKHVIWTYGNSPANAWKNTIRFETESNGFRPNTLALYLAGGGSALTCGRTDRPGGGLVEIFPQSPLLPASVLDELDGGRYSMAHDDYYVTVIDKVSAQFKSGDAMPAVNRSLARDALYMAIEAGGGADLDFPDTLMLDETVTCSNCFFNPHDRGFTYVEVYDPAYYMDFIGARSHPCFTPIYTMWARSSRSPIHGAAIALKGAISGHFSTCEPGRYAYYDSYHFGFPLWFMEHEKVEQIADEIFRAWEIR